MFDRHRDIISTHKAAALMRNAEAIKAADGWRGDVDAEALIAALYFGRVGVLLRHEREDVRTVVDLRDGAAVAVMFIRDGFHLP